jgi:membrane protease YdiL (CAAX protease family)
MPASEDDQPTPYHRRNEAGDPPPVARDQFTDGSGAVGRVPWTYAQTIRGALATLLPWVAFAVVSQLGSTGQKAASRPLPRGQDLAGGVSFFIFTIILEGAFVIAPFYYALSRRAPDVSVRDGLYGLGFRRTPLGPAIAWVVGGLVVVLVGSDLYALVIHALNLHAQTNTDTLMQEAKTMPLTVIGALAGSVFVAPLCEEIFFRGFLLGGLLRGMRPVVAVIVSALLFAIAHALIGSFAPLLLIGLVLAVVRWRTGSLWPGMAIHLCNNALATILVISALK